MSEIKIRDLYTGKPDAKDEINFEGLEEWSCQDFFAL